MTISHLIVPTSQLNTESGNVKFDVSDFFPPLIENTSLREGVSKLETIRLEDITFNGCPLQGETLTSNYSSATTLISDHTTVYPKTLPDVQDSITTTENLCDRCTNSWITRNLVLMIVLTVVAGLIFIVGCLGVWYTSGRQGTIPPISARQKTSSLKSNHIRAK
jgi:hypothetical protein